MNEDLFSQVNTALSIREETFLSVEWFDQLLKAKDAEHRSLILQGTAYALDEQDVIDLNAIEQVLMRHLFAEYSWAYQASPNPSVVTLFTLKYTYHNLKVFLKHKATKLDLKHLLLPVGPYSLEILEHLVLTFSAEHCPDFMLEELLATWQEYQDYQDVRVLEIGMDLAYFKHLKQLEQDFANPTLTKLIAIMIDTYNAITAKRAVDQKKPHSFTSQLLSDEGSLSTSEWIEIAENNQFSNWFSHLNPCVFDLDIRAYEEKMRAQTITALDLEYLAELLQMKLLEQAKLEISGPLPLAYYLLGKELEVKNLRLILTGLENQLPIEAMKERMRPIYGQ